MRREDKPLVWLHGEIKTPPFSPSGRIEAGTLLRRLQRGEALTMPQSRPMPTIGPRCHELRTQDEKVTWRIIFYLADDAVVILEVFDKKSHQTPKHVIETCQRRLRLYQNATKE
ncbi:MAG: type II toxin-antitoxin system RelE/ParE family toxin [Phycisphaeraceae bacterium]